MTSPNLELIISINFGSQHRQIQETFPPEVTVSALARSLIQGLGLQDASWQLIHAGVSLSPGARLGDCLGTPAGPIYLNLIVHVEETISQDTDHGFDLTPPVGGPSSTGEFKLPPSDSDSDSESELTLDADDEQAESGAEIYEEDEADHFAPDFDVPALGDESGSEALALDEDLDDDMELDLFDDEESGSPIVPMEDEADEMPMMPTRSPSTSVGRMAVEEDEEMPVSARAPAKAKKVTRRATVRYYTRVNPERVYPLLVIITKDLIEKVQKKSTSQKTSAPFQVKADQPIEIEPVLPGCDCYPPKVVARLGAGDLTATFRIVPRVVGTVDGAGVTIRQDHHLLADIPLKVKSSQRIWVLLSGVLTFVLPCFSAILKHFGIDFEGQSSSVYVEVTRAMFDWVSPLGLTLGLGATTGLLWWTTRPQAREVFWDIDKVGPEEKLAQIEQLLGSEPGKASQELAELLEAFPDFQPARLASADLHYHSNNYRLALSEYQRAFRLGRAQAKQYHRASFAASKLGENGTALRILQEAEKVLSPEKMPAMLLFNVGCYHVRLGNLEEAMVALRRAWSAGHKRMKSWMEDPDLDPLRRRADFKKLIDEITLIRFRCPRCEKGLRARSHLSGRTIKCPECVSFVKVPVTG